MVVEQDGLPTREGFQNCLRLISAVQHAYGEVSDGERGVTFRTDDYQGRLLRMLANMERWIEANGFFNSTDIDQAETEAVKLGAHIVSNSFECSARCFRPKAFAASGVSYVASAGDSAYFAAEPSRFGSVVSAPRALE